jgi:hypothetical protein
MKEPPSQLPNDTKFYLLVALAVCVTGLLVYLSPSWFAAIPGIVMVGLFRGNWPKLP